MSFWSDVYAGDAAKIAEAWEDGLDGDEPFVVAHANLPGILPDTESDSSADHLLQLACEVAGVAPFSFADSITHQLAGDDNPEVANSAAYLMSARWVELFATLTPDAATRVGARFAADNGIPTFDAKHILELVAALCAVCRVAREQDVSVVYTWTL